MIKACIFDLDGTIADTVESIAHAVNRVLEHFGLVPRPVEAFNFYAGAVSDRCARDCRRTRRQTGRVPVLWRYQYGYADRKRRRHVYRWCDVGIPPAPGADRQPCDGAARPAGGNLNAFSQKESGKIKRTEEKTRMGEYTEECINTFLMNQGQLFDEPVAENYDEAEAFLEDCLAVVADNLDDVRAYMEEEGMDVEEMSDAELEEQSEVFALPDGQYLIVMG